MYLKTLEIQGFKSFAEKIDLTFHSGLTAVVGPNGSGKSNIADAVRWVLGEQSAKTLRGGKMEDVIFAGTQYRKSVGFAAVSITFDNTDGTLPIGFSEVTVTRRIYRSGESEYLLNKTACRLKDIHELFMNTGIGREGYSIIGQGRIDEILSNRSEERRSVFEEAAGITKYKVRKKEAERKLEATRLNLERVNDIIMELESQLDPLHIQAETAKTYLSLSEELKGIEVAMFLETVEKARVKVDELKKHQEELKERIAVENSALENIKLMNQERTGKLEKLREVREIAEHAVRQLEAEKEKTVHQIEMDREKVHHLHQTNENFGEDLASYQDKLTAIEADIEKKKRRLATLHRDSERFSVELSEAENRLRDVLTVLSSGEVEIENTKQVVMDKQDVLSDRRIHLNNLKNDFEHTSDRKLKISAEHMQIGRERDRLVLTKEELEASLRSTRSDISEAKKLVSLAEEKLSDEQNRSEALRVKREEVTRQHSAKTSRHHVLQDLENSLEGYSHSVKALLSACRDGKELGKGIHGALAQLVRVNPLYETAIEVCLGGALQNVVTEEENDAKRAIDYLKKQHLGRATFLPIRAIKGRSIENSTMQTAMTMQGFLGTADEYVETEPQYREIIKNLLGRTLVVDNMDNGINIARRFDYGLRIVTQEGELFNSGGSMTGGSQPARNASLLGRQRLMNEIEEELKELSKEMIQLEAARKKAEDHFRDYSLSLETHRRNLSNLELIRMRDESQLLHIEDQIKKNISRQELLKMEENELLQESGSVSIEMQSEQNLIMIVEKEISELREIILLHQNRNKDEQKKRDEIHADVNDYRVSVLSVKESLINLEEQIQIVIEEKNTMSGSIGKRNEDRLKNDNRIIEIEGEISFLQTKTIKLSEELTGAAFRLSTADEELLLTEESYSGLLDDMASHNQEILQLQDENGKLEARLAKYDLEMETISTRLWDEYALTLATAEPFRHPAENVRVTQSRIAELKAQIRELGPVNVSAIEDYTKTKERHAFMSNQRNDLTGAEEKLGRVIHEITLVMKRQFLAQFEIINKNFSVVFRELFDGGAAEVQLSDVENVLESGIEVIVQPPGKKLQNMMLLSGGERAMVAISLIFAILRMRPAPFYLLDEIEASLDDANVYKFADYIQRYTEKIQFLVITHRKGTMEAADILYGVTMQEHGVSKVVSMRMEKQIVYQ